MDTIILTLHIIIAVFLIGVILLQRSEGGALGIGGGGGGGGLMGGRSAASALTRTTVILAVGFFATSFGLGFLSEPRGDTSGSVVEAVEGQEQDEDAPLLPTAPRDESAPGEEGESSEPDTSPEPPAPAEPEAEKPPAPPEPQ